VRKYRLRCASVIIIFSDNEKGVFVGFDGRESIFLISKKLFYKKYHYTFALHL
jgi:hypothetical protein